MKKRVLKAFTRWYNKRNRGASCSDAEIAYMAGYNAAKRMLKNEKAASKRVK